MDKKKYEALCFRAKAGDILLKITRSEMEIGMKNVLFIASEAVPFIKTGGLADVVGALPKYFNKDEFDVRVMIPKYTCIPWEYREKMVYKTHFYIDLAWRTQYVGVFEMEYQGVTFYFIDNEFYFSGPKPYSWIHEDIEKFAFFSKAALSAIPTLGFRPDIIHCHDWQTGLVPVYLKERFAQGEFYQGVKSVMTIHNLKFQGIWDLKKVKDITGLPDSYFTSDKLEAYKDANYLKGGIVYADMVTTVSSTYAEEIKTPFYGEHLEGLMTQKRKLSFSAQYCATADSILSFHLSLSTTIHNWSSSSMLYSDINLRICS